MKAKEKDDLSTPRRSSRISKAKNTSTKNSSRRKKASKNLGTGNHFTKREKTLIKNLNQWIRNGIERERKGEPLFPTGKNQRSPYGKNLRNFKILCRQTFVKCLDGNS